MITNPLFLYPQSIEAHLKSAAEWPFKKSERNYSRTLTAQYANPHSFGSFKDLEKTLIAIPDIRNIHILGEGPIGKSRREWEEYKDEYREECIQGALKRFESQDFLQVEVRKVGSGGHEANMDSFVIYNREGNPTLIQATVKNTHLEDYAITRVPETEDVRKRKFHSVEALADANEYFNNSKYSTLKK